MKDSFCYSCFRKTEQDKLYHIKYDTIIKDNLRKNYNKGLLKLHQEKNECDPKLLEHQRHLIMQGPYVVPAEKAGIVKLDDGPVREQDLMGLERANT